MSAAVTSPILANSVVETKRQSDVETIDDLKQAKLRKAWPRDIEDIEMSRSAAQHWDVLCDFRNTQNVAYPGIKRLAKRCKCSERTTQRALAELERKQLIGTPQGNWGGSPQAGYTIYHLHSDQMLCDECLAAREVRQCGKSTQKQSRSKQLAECTPVTICHPSGVTKTTGRGDKNDSAYKEGTALGNCFSEEVVGVSVQQSSKTTTTTSSRDVDRSQLTKQDWEDVFLLFERLELTDDLEASFALQLKRNVEASGYTLRQAAFVARPEFLIGWREPRAFLCKFSREIDSYATVNGGRVVFPDCMSCFDNGEYLAGRPGWLRKVILCSCTEGERLKLERQHICPVCRGTGQMCDSRFGDSPCFDCSASGVFFTEEECQGKNLCYGCFGRGKRPIYKKEAGTYDFAVCQKCAGRGTYENE